MITMVRGRDEAAARARLEAAFDSGDPNLLERFRRLAADHLEVIAGDIGEPNLGLDSATWHRLGPQRRPDHPPRRTGQPRAALQRSCSARMWSAPPSSSASRSRRRSSRSPTCRPSRSRCRSPRTTSSRTATSATSAPTRPVDSSYANGYANSKWAGEVLLREAHDLCGLPVAVFRSDMILAHTALRGSAQRAGRVHPADSEPSRHRHRARARSTRPDADGSPQRAHYDGLPVDFVAESIITLGRDVDGRVPVVST